jgi:hypothetical protein
MFKIDIENENLIIDTLYILKCCLFWNMEGIHEHSFFKVAYQLFC